MYDFVVQLTQKFKTPLSSREASWKDNPDDSETAQQLNMYEAENIYHINEMISGFVILHNSLYLPQMPKGRPLASAPLLQPRGRLLQMSQMRNDPSRPSLHLC